MTYPSTIPTELQQTIYDWFQFREVVDDDKFDVFFNRVLNRDYNRYYQLLRIEPGISEYDWLVQKYTEAQKENKVERDNTETLATNISDTGTISDSGSTVKGTSSVSATTHGHTIEDKNADELNGDTTESYQLQALHNKSTKTRSGAPIQTVTEDTRQKNQKHLEKINPMSISYSGGVSEPSYGSGGTLDAGGALLWDSPSGQSADFGKDTAKVTTSEIWNGTGAETRVIDDNETSVTSPTSPVTKEARKYDDMEIHSGTDTQTVSYGGQDTSSNTKTLNTDKTTTGNVINKGEENGLEREISTGRYDDPATLLKKAVGFILTTNAWEWLSNRLEVCFMGVYD